MTIEDAKTIGIIGGLIISSIALFLNFFSTLRNIKSQKISNYQEITKSHRDLWKLTIDNDQKYKRLLEYDINILDTPPTYSERKFVQLVFLHMTSAFYFAKYSHMLEIEKMAMDFDEFLSMPIPRVIWRDAKKYYNSDFVRFVDGKFIDKKIIKFLKYWTTKKIELDTKKTWNVLVLSAFSSLIVDKIKGYGDNAICLLESDPVITRKYIAERKIDIIVCFGYGRKIAKKVVECVTCINVHAGYLPYNRGPNPNLWAWMDGTPKGATVHYMDKNIDTGDIISQSQIRYGDGETLNSAFDKLIFECARLFNETWPKIRAGNASRLPQGAHGTAHTLKSQEIFNELFNDEWKNKPIEEFCKEAKKIIRENESPLK